MIYACVSYLKAIFSIASIELNSPWQSILGLHILHLTCWISFWDMKNIVQYSKRAFGKTAGEKHLCLSEEWDEVPEVWEW